MARAIGSEKVSKPVVMPRLARQCGEAAGRSCGLQLAPARLTPTD
jgi:hypothetical protein